MVDYNCSDEISVNVDDFLALVEVRRPPHNYFDYQLIAQLADVFEMLDADPRCRVVILASQGRSFSAGANFSDGSGQDIISHRQERHLYDEALRLFSTRKPIVGIIQGAAIGGGLGLALVPDFRIGCSESKFAANFTQLGFHPGFGLTYTLPALLGQQAANYMMYTGRRVAGEEALTLGLLDKLVPAAELRVAATEMAAEIARAAPLAVEQTRATLREGLPERIRAAMEREKAMQDYLKETNDFREGIAAATQRRQPDFKGN